MQSPFVINIKCLLHQTTITELRDTVDYEKIYEIIVPIFDTPYKLLEVLATDMGNAIKAAYIQINMVTITIEKMNPPIAAFQGKVGITVSL